MQIAEEALKFLNLGINSEIAAYVFYKRARKLVELVEKLIQERGEENVLYALKSREPAHAPVQ